MMKNNKCDLTQFLAYLSKRGYPQKSIRAGAYRYNNEEFSLVEIFDNKKHLIQAFVVMTESQKESEDEDPFFRRYKPKN